MPHVIQASSEPIQGEFAIVVSRYNESITSKLLEAAIQTLEKAGVSDDRIHVLWVPGAWEIPLAVQFLLQPTACVAAITLGAVIRGETTHDQHINRAVSQSLMKISLENNKPVSFGVLTVNSLEQALERSGGNVGNKGEEAALAAIEMVRQLARR